MKNLNKYLALLMVLVIANFSNTYSQDESITIKQTGKVSIFSTGKLKINSASGVIRTTGSAPGAEIVNQGEIQFNGLDNKITYNPNDVCEDDGNDDENNTLAYGQSATNRVPGLVVYGSADPQNVQARFYEDLTMAGDGNKSIPDGVAVSGAYLATGNNDRTYAGTFTYDGTDDQTILGETAGTSGAYNNVVLQGAGVKTLADATTADMQNLTIDPNTGNLVVNGTMNVGGALSQDATNVISIAGVGPNTGTLNLNSTTDPSTLAGDINVGEKGTFAMGSDVEATLTGDLALGEFADATISLAAGAELTVTGTMTNARTEGDNTDFDDLSTVIYNGATGQVVMATTEANPYGNLTISGTDEKTATGLVALSNNFTLDGANFDLGENCDDALTAPRLWMTDHTATATYGDGNTLSGFEVVGAFRRTIGSTSALPFNNYATQVAIDNPTSVNWIELCVLPGNVDYVAGSDPYDANRDVKRTIKYKYDVVSSAVDWAAEISYGYKTSELETAMNTTGFQNSLRFREITSSTTQEKLSTNEQPDRLINPSDPFNSITLAAIRPTGGRVAPQTTLAEAANGNLLFLRGGPTEFISVADGRWSNPATWDEGEQPGPEDVVKVRTNVHIGFTRSQVDNFTKSENEHINDNFGPTYTNRNTIASKIIINDDFGGTFDSQKATLIIGGTEQVGITKLTDPALIAIIPDSGTMLVKNATGAAVYADLAALKAATDDLATSTKVDYNHGVIMLEGSVLLARNNVCVEGAFNGAGEVNIGEED